MTEAPDFDLDAYLERIGCPGRWRPSLSTLEHIHRTHLGRIPFENVDVRLGRPIHLTLDALQDKLVRRRRGGYCFEQNALFAAALRALGFDVTTLEARVRPPGASSVLPRTHMLLCVEVDGADWLADVGFGGDGPLLPVPLDGAIAEQHDADYRVEPEGDGVFVLRHRRYDAWRDLYAFRRIPAWPVDFELANYYTSTHPGSVFVRTLTVQRSEPQVRHILRGSTYTFRRGGQETRRELTHQEVPTLLRESFALDLSDEEVLDALEARPTRPYSRPAPAKTTGLR